MSWRCIFRHKWEYSELKKFDKQSLDGKDVHAFSKRKCVRCNYKEIIQEILENNWHLWARWEEDGDVITKTDSLGNQGEDVKK